MKLNSQTTQCIQVFLSHICPLLSFMEPIEPVADDIATMILNEHKVILPGGLALMWRSGMDISLVNYSFHHISVIVTMESGQVFQLTLFYGSPYVSDSVHSWQLLKIIAAQTNFPWVLMGDFKEILRENEVTKFSPIRITQMDLFRSTLHCCGLHDTSFSDNQFTCSNKRFKVSHEVAPYSDHCPIMLFLSTGMCCHQQCFR